MHFFELSRMNMIRYMMLWLRLLGNWLSGTDTFASVQSAWEYQNHVGEGE